MWECNKQQIWPKRNVAKNAIEAIIRRSQNRNGTWRPIRCDNKLHFRCFRCLAQKSSVKCVRRVEISSCRRSLENDRRENEDSRRLTGLTNENYANVTRWRSRTMFALRRNFHSLVAHEHCSLLNGNDAREIRGQLERGSNVARHGAFDKAAIRTADCDSRSVKSIEDRKSEPIRVHSIRLPLQVHLLHSRYEASISLVF